MFASIWRLDRPRVAASLGRRKIYQLAKFKGNHEVAERLISGCKNYTAKGVPLGKWAKAKYVQCEHQI
jgi:hypothetical protein